MGTIVLLTPRTKSGPITPRLLGPDELEEMSSPERTFGLSLTIVASEIARMRIAMGDEATAGAIKRLDEAFADGA